ncbi:polypeptide deformylase [Streptococcus pneumoniae]|nr:polypeptide deformylase [Streptococcus pneumoniae]VSY38515.1 polypeptide deformylase [Streptococcus pneumoniae]
MEKKIVKDILFLSQVSQPASQEDLYLARDLQDTLLANHDTCVGLAANMIGVQKRVIIFNPKSFIPLSTRCNLQNP